MADEPTVEPTAEATPPVAAITGALAHTASQYEAAERAERRAENPDADGVFDGPYDAQKMLGRLFELLDEVRAAEGEYKRATEKQKDAKTELDGRRAALEKTLTRCRSLERARETGQPFLRTLTDEERDGETADRRRARLADAVRAKRNCYVTADELASLERLDLVALDTWVDKLNPEVPLVVATRAHVAGELGADGTFCRRCGARLSFAKPDEPFPAGAYVGLDCAGEPTPATPPSGDVVDLQVRGRRRLARASTRGVVHDAPKGDDIA